jgi:hypothetical protein
MDGLSLPPPLADWSAHSQRPYRRIQFSVEGRARVGIVGLHMNFRELGTEIFMFPIQCGFMLLRFSLLFCLLPLCFPLVSVNSFFPFGHFVPYLLSIYCSLLSSVCPGFYVAVFVYVFIFLCFSLFVSLCLSCFVLIFRFRVLFSFSSHLSLLPSMPLKRFH